MAILDDWLDYLADPGAFDPYDYGPLITSIEDDDDLTRAFGSLPQGDALIERIKLVRSQAEFTGLYYIPPVTNHAQQLSKQDLARNYTKSVADVLDQFGKHQLATKVLENPLIEVSVADWKRSDPSNPLKLNNVFEILEDKALSYASGAGDWLYGLEEAVRGMTTIPEVTRYIIQPISNFPLDDKIAYDLWLSAYRMDFGDEANYLIALR